MREKPTSRDTTGDLSPGRARNPARAASNIGKPDFRPHFLVDPKFVVEAPVPETPRDAPKKRGLVGDILGMLGGGDEKHSEEG